MIALPLETVLALPVDELGLEILRDFAATNQWNTHSYVLSAREGGYPREALRALTEAFGWLHVRGLLARDPDQSSPEAVFVTRAGRRVIVEGPATYYAVERLQGGSHPLIDREARPQFLIARYELGVFASMKAVEVRVRDLAGLGDDVIGVDLMNKAFGPTGTLTDHNAQKGEREGTRALFAGAYALFRNPAGHRPVDYDDVSEAAECVQTASLLMRILDRVEERIS